MALSAVLVLICSAKNKCVEEKICANIHKGCSSRSLPTAHVEWEQIVANYTVTACCELLSQVTNLTLKLQVIIVVVR